MSERPRVCIIGCGPSGMSVLYQFNTLPKEKIPDIVCFEKQRTWGGLWNVTWRTGTDEYGERIHSGMYPQLWANLPKECMEYYDYTWDEHLGKALPSYAPVKVIKSYLEGRMENCGQIDLKTCVRFSTTVKRVEYLEDTDTFSVTVHDLEDDKEEIYHDFTHVIVASGIFTVANSPTFQGIDVFKGRILHSKDFREVSMFKGKRILIVGAGRSAEDLIATGIKFGADKIISCWKSRPMEHNWPENVEERPLVERLDENTAYFKDGFSANIDVVVLCTGYHKHFSFLPDELRLKSALPVSFYPDDLYKGIVWMKGGNGKVLYIGAQNAAYTFPMFDAQALWACKYVIGDIRPINKDRMVTDFNTWKRRCDSCKTTYDDVDFQSEYIRNLCEEVGYTLKCIDVRKHYHTVLKDKAENLFTFRNEQFASVYTGTMSTRPKAPWMDSFDPSYEAFVNQN